jgi:leucyl-tRNA synthetase
LSSQEVRQRSAAGAADHAGKRPAGVDTGRWVRHPVTGARLPVWVGDYVLSHFGTGAVMVGLPFHPDPSFHAAPP